MTNELQLKQIAELTAADYRLKEQSFQKIVAEENAIRADLAKLDARLRASRGDNQDIKMKSLGADILWQSWVGQRKTELNMKLARVLAVKEQHVGAFRKAFGRKQVSHQMLDEAHQKKQRARAKLSLDQAIELAVFKGLQ